MDSFDTLFEKRQYDLIVKATENATDAISLFYRIMSLASLTRVKEAIITIENNRKTLEDANMKLIVELHIDLLLMSHDFDAAYRELSYYKELPYVSQEVEERLNALPKEIREAEKEYYLQNVKNVNPDDVNRILRKGSEEEIIGILDLLRGYDVSPYLDNLISLLKNYPKQSLRAFTLLLLKFKGIGKEVGYLYNGEVITVNPLKLEAPFDTETFKKCEEFLRENEKNITLANNAVTLFSTYVMLMYPHILTLENDLLILVAVKQLASKYLNQSTNIEKACKEHHLDYQEVANKMNEIEKALELF